MGVEERGNLLHKDVLPFGAMVMVEIMLVGGNTLFKSATAQQINSYVFTFYVFLIGFIIFLPYFFIHYRSKSIPPIKLDIVGKIFILSVLMYLSQVFGYMGLKYSSPTLSSIMGNLSPAFTFILAFLFRLEKVHLQSYASQAKIIGTIVTISGAIIATVYSGPSVLSDSVSLDWILGGLLLAFQYFLLALSLVAQGFASGFFNVLIQIWILRVKGPVYVSMFKPLTIVIALIMGVMFLGDTPYIGSVLGGSIITIGFYGVVWGKAKESEDAPPNQITAPLLETHDVLEQGSLIS